MKTFERAVDKLTEIDQEIIRSYVPVPVPGTTGGTCSVNLPVSAEMGASITTAYAALPLGYGSYPVGTICLPSASNATWSSKVTISSPGVSLIGPGSAASVFNCSGNDDCLVITHVPFGVYQGSKIGGFRLNGNSGASAVGIHLQASVGRIFEDIVVSGFTGTGSSALWLENHDASTWTERNTFIGVHLDNSTKLLRFSTNGGVGDVSFGYNRFLDLRMNPVGAQKVFSFEDNSYVYYNTIRATINKGGVGSIIFHTEGTAQFIDSEVHIFGEEQGSGGGLFDIGAGTVFRPLGGIEFITDPSIISIGAITPNSVNLPFAHGLPNVSTPWFKNLGGSGTGPWLIPSQPPNAYRTGLGFNTYFDNVGATNWIVATDGANNGGALITNNHASVSGEMVFHAFPRTGGTNQTIPVANLSNYETGSWGINGLYVLGNNAYPAASGYHAGTFRAQTGINEGLALTQAGVSGIGSVLGTDIDHPLVWGYESDSSIFEWYKKRFAAALISTDRRAYMGTNGEFYTWGDGNPGIFGKERRLSTTFEGLGLTVDAGGAKAGQTNKAGGDLNLRAGISTGSGGSSVNIQTATPGGSATTDRTPTTKLTVDGYGHLISASQTPVISACGTGSPSVAGNDIVGKITTGGGALTSCLLTFGNAWTNAPSCFVNDETTALFTANTTTTGTMTVKGAVLTSVVISYHCFGR